MEELSRVIYEGCLKMENINIMLVETGSSDSYFDN